MCSSTCLANRLALLCPAPRVGALSDDARLTSVCLTSDVCLFVAYIGYKSKTERPRKTKIGTEVAHVTRDSDTTSKVKGQFAGGGGVLWRPPAQLVLFNFVGYKRSYRALFVLFMYLSLLYIYCCLQCSMNE